MLIWMLCDLIHIKKDGEVIYMDERKIYSVPDDWGKMIVESQAGAEFIIMGGSK